MTKRERKYMKDRREERELKLFYRQARKQAWLTVFECNMMGSRIFLNEDGNVEAKILSTQELIELKSKIDNGESVPEDTIFKQNVQ